MTWEVWLLLATAVVNMALVLGFMWLNGQLRDDLTKVTATLAGANATVAYYNNELLVSDALAHELHGWMAGKLQGGGVVTRDDYVAYVNSHQLAKPNIPRDSHVVNLLGGRGFGRAR